MFWVDGSEGNDIFWFNYKEEDGSYTNYIGSTNNNKKKIKIWKRIR